MRKFLKPSVVRQAKGRTRGGDNQDQIEGVESGPNKTHHGRADEKHDLAAAASDAL